MSKAALLLQKNTSWAQLVGFTLSNFVGLAIVVAAVQFFVDLRPLWDANDSFIRTDHIVINKRVTSANTLGEASSRFLEPEIADLEKQPWVRKVGRFNSTDYTVVAGIEQGSRSMSTYMFFESIPSSFIDAPGADWTFKPGDHEVPIILSKDYLSLYNFGFSTSAGLPQVSEAMIGSIPLRLTLRSDDGTRMLTMQGRVAGFSNRLNTILVPEEFMEWSNSYLGTGKALQPSRLIVDVSSPGDVAIKRYLEAHDWELAGDKKASSASFLINVLTGVVLVIGAVITLLSFFILMLSISLLMQKNREKMRLLIALGFPLRSIMNPYRVMIVCSCAVSLALAIGAAALLRASYLDSIRAMTEGHVGEWWLAPLVGIALTLIIIGCNWLAVRRRVVACAQPA